MEFNKTAIVLGGIAAHIELIDQLKDRGYFTILVDYLPNPPAKHIADMHLQESTLDKDKVLDIAKKHNASLILSGCVDQANITAAFVNERLGLHTPYSYQTALNITNKVYMKEVMMKESIPTAKYYSVDREIDANSLHLNYPVIVKPADSNSANGVKKVYDSGNLSKALNEALEISRSNKAIVEEYIEGQEFSAYCYVQDKKAKLLMTNERFSVFDGDKNIIKCYASLMPANLPQSYNKGIEHIATQIANAFNLNNTPLFYQAIYRDGQFYVIEFAPRFGGGVCFYTIPLNTGFNAIGSIISSQLGEKVNVEISDKPYLTATNTVYANDCIFDHIEDCGTELVNSDNFKFFAYKSKGSIIDNKSASGSRIGGFVVKASNKTDLKNIITSIFERMKVVSSEGKNEIRHDLNLLSQSIL